MHTAIILQVDFTNLIYHVKFEIHIVTCILLHVNFKWLKNSWELPAALQLYKMSKSDRCFFPFDTFGATKNQKTAEMYKLAWKPVKTVNSVCKSGKRQKKICRIQIENKAK